MSTKTRGSILFDIWRSYLINLFNCSRDGNSIVEGNGEVVGSASTSAEFPNTLNETNAEFALSRTCGSVGTSAECSSNSESGFCEWEIEERREADGGKRYQVLKIRYRIN